MTALQVALDEVSAVLIVVRTTLRTQAKQLQANRDERSVDQVRTRVMLYFVANSELSFY